MNLYLIKEKSFQLHEANEITLKIFPSRFNLRVRKLKKKFSFGFYEIYLHKNVFISIINVRSLQFESRKLEHVKIFHTELKITVH